MKLLVAISFAAVVAMVSANQVTLRGKGCDDPEGGCGDGDDCHPKCQWKCDSPVCNQVCEPICEPPKCSTRCHELGCSKCEIKCNKPECEVRCPVKHCEKGRCPECETVCKDPLCHTECTNPEPTCESVCEEPICDWKCHRPSNSPKPKCALVCEKSPHCQEQPKEEACCPCAEEDKEGEKTEATVTAKVEDTKKCCGCAAKEGASPSSGDAAVKITVKAEEAK